MGSIRDKVEHKLYASILPRLEGGRTIDRTASWRAFTIYRGGHEAAIALIGMGLSHPFVAWMAEQPASDASAAAFAGGAFDGLAQLPSLVLAPVVCIFVLWVALRAFVAVKKLDQKVPHYELCKLELGAIESRLDEVLSREDPLQGLGDVLTQSQDVVGRYHSLGKWPYSIGPEGRDQDIRRRAKELCDRHEKAWEELPAIQRRPNRVKAGAP